MFLGHRIGVEKWKSYYETNSKNYYYQIVAESRNGSNVKANVSNIKSFTVKKI